MKKLFFIVGCIFLLNTALGQTSTITSKLSLNGAVDDVVIREYRHPSTISCVFTRSNSTTFIYMNSSAMAKEFLVEDLKVNDMIISNGADGKNDTVFFCGHHPSTGLATFGYFNINNAFNGNGPIRFQDSIQSGEPGIIIADLTRMTQFSNNANTHYACVGTNEIGNPCLVEFVIGPAPSIWYYRSGTVTDSPEKFCDVKVVSNLMKDYLVTAGMDYDYGRYLNLRIYNTSDIFATSGIQDKKHIFCIDTTFGVEWYNEDAFIRLVREGFFSTVSYLKPNLYDKINGSDPVYPTNSLHVGVFSINALASGSLTSMNNSYVFEPLNIAQNNLMGYETGYGLFSTYDQSVLEKYRDASSNETSSFCELKFDYGANLISAKRKDAPGMVFYRHDDYNSWTGYVLGGRESANPNMLVFGTDTYGSTDNCFAKANSMFLKYNPYMSVKKTRVFNTTTKNCYLKQFMVDPIESPCTIICPAQ